MSMEFKEYPDREMLALSLADRLASQLSQHLRAHEAASLCVPGGTSPMQVFDTLSGSDLDWGRVTVFLGDERWVDGEHKRSNSRLLRRHLLQDKAAAARYIDLYTGDPQPDDATGALAGLIERNEGRIDEVDVTTFEAGEILTIADFIRRDRACLKELRIHLRPAGAVGP